MGWSSSRKTGLLYSDERSYGGYTVIVPNGIYPGTNRGTLSSVLKGPYSLEAD